MSLKSRILTIPLLHTLTEHFAVLEPPKSVDNDFYCSLKVWIDGFYVTWKSGNARSGLHLLLRIASVCVLGSVRF